MLSCFVGLTFASCGDGSEPENSGEVEQTAPDWTIGVWETVGDNLTGTETVDGEEYEISYYKKFEITETTFQWLMSSDEPIHVFGEEKTLEEIDFITKEKISDYTIKLVVTKKTDKEFVLDSYVNGKNLGPHFGLEKEGDKVYFRNWNGDWGLTKERWEVVKL